jgi:hypothetical protein
MDLRSLFHLGTWNAPRARGWTTAGGSHDGGSGLNVSLRARVAASEALLDRGTVEMVVKVSMDETRCNDMAGALHGETGKPAEESGWRLENR